ncbi:MAG: ATP-dependent zinc metalloprotease FtsH [Thermoguttaceae bacterium]
MKKSVEKAGVKNRPASSSRINLWNRLLVCAVFTLIVSAVFSYYGAGNYRKGAEIQIMDLLKLIEMGPFQNNPKAYVEVHEGASDHGGTTYRYSGLDNLVIGPSQISGTVNRAIIKSQFKRGKIERNIPFYTPFYGLDKYSNNIFETLIRKGFTNVRAAVAPSMWSTIILPMLIVMMPILLLIFYAIWKQGRGGLAAKFSRSRGKLFAEQDIQITFKDVAGIEEALDELREVVDFLKQPHKYQELGGKIPKGVLLVGPPGTGKTLLAKAIAGEANVPFFSLSGSDFVEMFAGVGAARVRDMFKQAQTIAPCIVFIDELDALGKIRSAGASTSNDEREQTLNALLVEMDGFNSNSGVIILAATNRPETLDPALLRPGRFDRHVLVDRPDVRGRKKILQVHVQNIKLDKSVDLREIARITSGFVGADLANLVNEAALLSARASKSVVSMREFTEGVERITKGLEKRQPTMRDEEKQRLAYHESAHALLTCCLSNADPMHKISIIPRGSASPDYGAFHSQSDRYLLTQGELIARIQVLLAGSAAEELFFSDISTSAQRDLARATEIARAMVMNYGMSRLGRITYRESAKNSFLPGGDGFSRDRNYSEQTAREIDEEVRNIINNAYEKVRHILDQRRSTLSAVAQRLIEKEVLDVPELKKIIETNSSGPSIVPGDGDSSAIFPAVGEVASIEIKAMS